MYRVIVLLERNWVTIVIAVIGIAMTWLISWISRRVRKPCYIAYSEQLIGRSAVLSPHVQVLHQGQNVPQVTLTRLVFWNAGREPIRAEDIAQGDPVKVRLAKDTHVIHASAARVTRDSVKFSVHATPFDAVPGEVSLRFDFLDHKDGARVDILHTGLEGDAVQITGTIIGAGDKIVKRHAFRSMVMRPSEWSRRHRQAMWLAIAAVLICVGYGLSITYLASNLKSIKPPPPMLQYWMLSAFLVTGLCFASAIVRPFLWPPFPAALIGEADEERPSEICLVAPPAVEIGAQAIFCSGVGEDEQFDDTDGTVRDAVVLERRTAWKPVSGAEYVWARPLPTLSEAREGCEATLRRIIELGATPRRALLILRVDDEADVYVNDVQVGRCLRGYDAEAHEVDVTQCLHQGDNNLKIVVRNDPMDIPNLTPENNPTAVAYRLEVEF